MTWAPVPGPLAAGEPDAGALARLVLARASARAAVGRAAEGHEEALLAVFDREIGIAVDRVSPLLVALLEHVGLDLDDVVRAIRPAMGWPDRPPLPTSRGTDDPTLARMAGRSRFLMPSGCHGVDVDGGAGRRLAVRVVDHSIEVFGVHDGLRFASRFGRALLGPCPRLLRRLIADGAQGRPAAEFVDHPALRGRPWPVTGVERRAPRGMDVVCDTGSHPYRAPWTR